MLAAGLLELHPRGGDAVAQAGAALGRDVPVEPVLELADLRAVGALGRAELVALGLVDQDAELDGAAPDVDGLGRALGAATQAGRVVGLGAVGPDRAQRRAGELVDEVGSAPLRREDLPAGDGGLAGVLQGGGAVDDRGAAERGGHAELGQSLLGELGLAGLDPGGAGQPLEHDGAALLGGGDLDGHHGARRGGAGDALARLRDLGQHGDGGALAGRAAHDGGVTARAGGGPAAGERGRGQTGHHEGGGGGQERRGAEGSRAWNEQGLSLSGRRLRVC